MKRILIFCSIYFITLTVQAQTDTIFTNNEKIPCVVKEITGDAVQYSFLGEELRNTIYKNAVQKIVFKSGRVQIFAEATSYKKINSISDYDNVVITQVEGEVKGLFKLGDASSKAKGTTVMSNQERVKERAYRKLKIQAAFQGANVIYLTDQRGQGNKGGRYGSSTETSLTGVVYTNQLPSFEQFKRQVGTKQTFEAIQEAELYSSSSDYTQRDISKSFKLTSLTNENGLILINGSLDGISKYSKFRVVSFTKDTFSIFYEDKSTAYNIMIKM